MSKTPTIEIEVICTLVSPVSKAKVKEPTRVSYKHAISEETKDFVSQFYQDDAISCVMPGKKDVVTVRTSGIHKQKQHKHLLLDDIVESVLWVTSTMGNSCAEAVPGCLQGVFTTKILTYFARPLPIRLGRTRSS